ncbi:MAG: ABC transporter substrate-binding protein [Solirubrobacteraceae bacterium]
MKLSIRPAASVAVAVAVALAVGACGSSSGSSSSGGSSSGGAQSGTAGLKAPQANTAVPTSVGSGEGKLNLVAWEGYAQPQWVKPFEASTGCQVSTKYAGSSSEMVSLMANGGGGQYDLVSASGDADLRLIYAGDVKPINISLIPSWKDFHPFLQSPAFNTIDGKHYGVSYEFGPNVLLYSTKAFAAAPTSWSVLYNKQYSGRVTVPDNPIQIADAALYLSKTQPNLGITDPYELTQPQFDATISLLKQQHPLIKKYWDLASQEISLFQSGTTTVGAAWPYQTNSLRAAGAKVADTIPSQGATGWADTWMLGTKAPHPNCAYKWMQWVTTPKIQAQQAIYFGETPANKLACPIMDKMQKGSCAAYHANAPEAYFQTLKFWKTPLAQCGNGKTDCVPFQQWVSAWTQVIG